MSSQAVDQDAGRFRLDDGTEAGATWFAPLNTDIKGRAGWTFRLRYLLQEYGGKEANFQPEWRYSYNGGAYTLITTSSSVIQLTASGTVSDGTATTQQLGAGDFNGGEFDSNGTMANEAFTKNDEREYEGCFALVPADVAPGDTVAIQMYRSGGTALDSYTNTLTLTVRQRSNTGHIGQQ
jgi:hypothetical protein